MPFHLPVKEIVQILQADLLTRNDDLSGSCQGVAIDSREVSAGNLFFARRGESSDGHQFIANALDLGARACVVEKSWVESQYQSFLQRLPTDRIFCFLVVSDTTQTLGKLAAYWRKTQLMPVAVVTGSSGKTTTKEMIGSLLAQAIGIGMLSQKSFNNHVGLPFTILQSSAEDRWMVLEAGMNHPGELAYLGAISSPDVAVVLNVGLAHLEFFQTINAIADAKCELLEYVSSSGTAIVCGDDKNLLEGTKRLEQKIRRSLRYTTFGLSPNNNIYATDIASLGIDGTTFTVHYQDKHISAKIPHIGIHNVANALAALAVVKSAFPEKNLDDFVAALTESKQAAMRFEIIEYPGLYLINDTYNANPVSMAASLETAASLTNGKNFIVIFGDMLELGPRSKDLHVALGQHVAHVKATKLIALGKFAEDVVSAARTSGLHNAYVASSPIQASELAMRGFNSKKGVILVKGSRGMALEHVVAILKEILSSKNCGSS